VIGITGRHWDGINMSDNSPGSYCAEYIIKLNTGEIIEIYGDELVLYNRRSDRYIIIIS
jgi:hypothetical protein